MVDYVLEGPRWSSGSGGSAGVTVAWFADSSIPSSFLSVLTAAFADWSSYANIHFTQVSSSASAKIVFNDSPIDGLDNTLGRTNYSYSGQNLISATITFDSGEGWHSSGSKIVSNDNINLFNVALHEIGHAIGLDHYEGTPAIMNAYLDRSVTDLAASDIHGAQALYGAAIPAKLASLRRTDLNGDGTSDVLFQSGGSLVSWSVRNAAIVGATSYGNVGSFAAKATGDVNGDGTSDILFQDPSGSVVSFTMQNGSPTAGTVLGQATGFSLVGSGDFNGDGTDDVLFRNDATGAIDTWTMQNGKIVAGAEIGQAGGFRVAGVGDFNGDGTDDILLQNGSTVVEWIMGNGQITQGRTIGGAGNYQVVGVGDLNGDGTSDILLQNGGSVVEWLMGAGQITSGRQLGGDVGSFQVAAVGDYTGDGTADVLFKGGDGSAVAWTVQNGQVTAGTLLGNAGNYGVIA